MTKQKKPSGKVSKKALATADATAMPPTWYFPSPDPDYVIACDYDPVRRVYSVNCRPIRKSDMPKNLKAAYVRITNAMLNA